MSETRTEWAVWFEYDGTVETFLDEQKARRYVAWFLRVPERGTATVVSRTVTVTDWTEAEG